MDSEKVIKRLRQLHAIARLRPGEENDAGRLNEARNAAFLLLKTASDNGFDVLFERADSPRARAERGVPCAPLGSEEFASVMQDIFGGMARDLRQQRPKPSTARVIRARYSGFCRVCGQTYAAKERVVWSQGQLGSLHVRCAG